MGVTQTSNTSSAPPPQQPQPLCNGSYGWMKVTYAGQQGCTTNCSGLFLSDKKYGVNYCYWCDRCFNGSNRKDFCKLEFP